MGLGLGLGAVTAGVGKRGVGHGALMLSQAPLRLLWLAVLLALFRPTTRPEPKGRGRASNLVVVRAAVTEQSVARVINMNMWFGGVSDGVSEPNFC